MAETGWGRHFDDEMALPDGRALRTLRDAGEYVTRLPKAEQAKQHWQTAPHKLSAIGDGAHHNGYRLAGAQQEDPGMRTSRQ